VFSELRKVTWPTREEATRLALLVLAVGISMGLLLGFVDMGFSRFITFLSGS
jgi:preprotein translocase subunit SecE